jgi:hypothetical protein
VLEAFAVERATDRADAPVHHVARAHGVGSGLGVADGRPREQLERKVVDDLPLVDHPAVAMGHVLAETDIGEEHELGHPLAQGAQRLLDDAVIVVSAGGGFVLLLRDAEEENGADAERVDFLRFGAEPVDGPLRDAVETFERVLHARARASEEREDEVASVDARLAHEIAQRRGAPKAPQTGHRKD